MHVDVQNSDFCCEKMVSVFFLGGHSSGEFFSPNISK